MAQLGAVDHRVLLLVKDAESFDEILDGWRVAVLGDCRQDRKERLETDPEVCHTYINFLH